MIWTSIAIGILWAGVCCSNILDFFDGQSTDDGPAVQFLLGNHFSIDALCKQGVHYLSRDEETQAWAHANIKVNRNDVVDVKETDQETLDFLKAVRHAIDNWLAQGEVQPLLNSIDI